MEMPNGTLYAIKFVGHGQVYWDNNFGANYNIDYIYQY
ncbi:MAG: CBM21 domain-containing protein [Lachnospiraceae bacterium]|nr:CBM21 domain-containing protein [Lachnospiraceae bacterium]